MLTDRKFLTSGALLTLSQVAVYGMSFLRNLILARALTNADFGIAAALSISISLLELVGRMSFGRQIIQATEGDDPVYQGVAHGVQAVMGTVSMLLVVAGAWPLSLAFGIPGDLLAFMAIAFVPLFRGFMHLDLARVQRKLAFGPQVMAETVPQVIATAVAWPLAHWLNDYRAVILIMLVKETLTLLLSHLLAERRYQLSWRSSMANEMVRFGWPLVAAGLISFVAAQGDKFVVGAFFPPEDLASYSLAFLLASTPWTIFSQVGSTLLLPMFCGVKDNQASFSKLYTGALQVCAVFGVCMASGFLIVGHDIVTILYGQKYAGVEQLAVIMAAVFSLRFLSLAPGIAAMASGDTKTFTFCSIARSGSILAAIFAIRFPSRGLATVAACGIVGEILALVVAALRVAPRYGLRSSVYFSPVAFLVMSLIAVNYGLEIFTPIHRSIWMNCAVWLCVSAAVILTGVLIFWKVLGKRLKFALLALVGRDLFGYRSNRDGRVKAPETQKV